MALIADFITVDAHGFECIEEADLDAAYQAEDAGKALRLPQTCLGPDAPRDIPTLAWALGHAPTRDEWLIYSGQALPWFTGPLLYDLEDPILADGSLPCCTITNPPVDIPAPVPLPASGALLALALVAVICRKTLTK